LYVLRSPSCYEVLTCCQANATSGTRRRAAEPIVFAFTVATTSTLLNSLTAAVLQASGFQFQGVPIAVVGSSLVITRMFLLVLSFSQSQIPDSLHASDADCADAAECVQCQH
jgi:hypothetical protein